MNHITIIILITMTVVFSGCGNIKPSLVYAKDYEVVDEISMDLKAKNRTGRMFSIVSTAQTMDELAQTGMLAAYELHREYGYDLISVLLYPNKDLIRTGAYYVQVEYASDDKGIQGLQGVDELLFTSGKWKVRSADKVLSAQELSILNLWYGNQHKFPSKNILSSSSFDQTSLKDYIAKELNIDMAEVDYPHITRKDYKGVKLKSWMTPEPN